MRNYGITIYVTILKIEIFWEIYPKAPTADLQNWPWRQTFLYKGINLKNNTTNQVVIKTCKHVEGSFSNNSPWVEVTDTYNLYQGMFSHLLILFKADKATCV